MKNKHGKEIIILGVKVEKANMPEMYRLAKANPQNLKLILEGVMAKRGFKNPGSALALLESDLE
ncbi:MAG TPA: hypothetical protein DCL44_11620 [Elusimicrobia bacterium]|nr:hypothetical protein [Elusimicrobiota bacterium]